MAESPFTFESENLDKSIKFPSSLQLSRKSGLSLSRVSLDSTLSEASTIEIASALRAQQDEMQKKAFTRWCNSHLVGKDKIRDLYMDFRDGVLLIKFLRCLSGKEFAKPEKGKMRIHAFQNLQACVRFLIKNDVFLDKVCTGAEDIAAGTPSNTLGMVFLIYLKFQFKGTDLASKDEAGMMKAITYWAKQQTAEYDDVNVENLTKSWQDGLAFNAIIHKNHPDLIDYEEMKRIDPFERLENAFKVAEELGIPQLMESEDVLRYADKRSMFLYISSLYQHFITVHSTVGQKRIRAAVRAAYNYVRDSNDYERKAREFVEWMDAQVGLFEDTEHFKQCEFEELEQLKEIHEAYLCDEKKSRLEEELYLFELYTLLLIKGSANNLVPYQAPPGLIPQDLDHQLGELATKEHSYRLKLFLRLQHLKEIERLQKRFDKRAKILEDRIKKHRNELPANPSKDESTCVSQIKQLTTLADYFNTFQERFTPLDNIIADLQKLSYKFIQRNIHKRDELLSAFNNLKVIVDSKKWLFSICLEFHRPDEEFGVISPRVNHIFDTLTLAKRQGTEIDSLEEHPMFLITEIKHFAELTESNISLILEKLHSLEFIPESNELIGAYQKLLDKYKPLRSKISSAKDLVMYFLNMEREQFKSVSTGVDFNTLMLTTTLREIEVLEREFTVIKSPNKQEDFQEFQNQIGLIRLKSLTLQNRVDVCLPDIDGREGIDGRISTIIEKCTNLERSSLETGWLWGLLNVLKDILEHLRGVNEKIGQIERREKEVQNLNSAELETLIEYKFETSIFQDSVKSILIGCPYVGELLPPYPDFSSHAQITPIHQSITQILRRIQPAISQLLERQENRTIDVRDSLQLQDLGSDAIRGWVWKLQGLADDVSFGALDFDSLAEQESQLRYLELAVDLLEENKFTDGVPELKRSVVEKRKRKDSVWKRLLILSKIERGRTYLVIKSGELENVTVNPSLQTEKYYKSMHSEIEIFQDKLSDWCEGDSKGLDSESRFECAHLQNEFDSSCNELLDKLENLMKKCGEKEKSQKLVDETAVEFISWCESPEFDSSADLTLLSEDPFPTDKLKDCISFQNLLESEFAKNKPVYEKLINELYHSGFANGREKGKEVQKCWQVLEQNMSENAKKTGFITNCIAFQTEFTPLMNIIDRINSEEIPLIKSEFSQTPSFEESENLSVKITTLIDLVAFIANIVLGKVQLKNLLKESTELIGAEEANRYFAPKITKLENGIEKATTELDDLKKLLKCWITFYVLDGRSSLERNWARDEIDNSRAESLNDRKISELTNWANHLKQNWIQEKIAPKQYQNFPENLRSRIISSLNETNRTLDELLLRVSQHKEIIEEGKNDREKLRNVKSFEDKLNSLENTSEDFQVSQDLVDTAKKISELDGNLFLLTKLQDEIQARDPESQIMDKIPALKKLYEDLILNLESRRHSFHVCIDLQTHIERMSEAIDFTEILPFFDTLDFEQLLRNYFQVGLRKIFGLSCKKFLDELDTNPLENKVGIEFEENLAKLRDLYEKLNRLIESHEKAYPVQEGILTSETRLDEAMGCLGDTEFTLSNNPSFSELTYLEFVPSSIQGYVSSCNENPDLQARRDEVTEKSENIGDQIQTQKDVCQLENVEKVIFLDLVDFFKKWLEPILEEFTTVSNEKIPKFSTVAIQDYYRYVLMETAPKLYSVLQEECTKGGSLPEEMEGIWPIEEEFIDENTAKLEFSLNSRLFLLFVEESINSIRRMRERVPNPDSFKEDIPLAKISPELCNASLRVAGSLYSTSSDKYHNLTEREIPSDQSAQFLASMQSLSQAYNDLVEKCKLVVTEARASVVRDPIVKKVRQLRRSQSQLDEMLERISEEEEPPQLFDSGKEIEARLASHELACRELPRMLAASRDPENSLAPGDIQEVQENAVNATQSLDNSQNAWNQTKALFGRKELLQMFKLKEKDLETKKESIDEVELETTLDAWELWADTCIDKLSNLEITDPETTKTRPSLSESLSLDSFTESEYAISDFTTVTRASFELTSLDLNAHFEYFNINPVDSIAETLETPNESYTVKSAEGYSLEVGQYTLDSDSINSYYKENDTPLQTLLNRNSSSQISQDLEFEFKSALTPITQIKSQSLSEKVEETFEQIVLEHNPDTFDFTKLAFDVVSQESIDGDPARPSPVHRVLDVRDSEDGEEFARNIMDIMMSGDESYVKRGSEYEGMERVEEVVELREQPVVESAFNFDALFEDASSTTDDNISRDTIDSERQGKAVGKNGSRKRRHVSFTREDVVIGGKMLPIPQHDVLVSGRKQTVQGFLPRKQELLTEGRKPLKRQWKDMFIVLKPGRLEFYKDPIEMAVGNFLSPEVILSAAVCEVPSDYTKKDFVFRIKCANGTSYLFQTSDSNCLSNWVTAINQSIILSTQPMEGYTLVSGRSQPRSSDEADSEGFLERETEEAKGKSKLPKFFSKK